MLYTYIESTVNMQNILGSNSNILYRDLRPETRVNVQSPLLYSDTNLGHCSLTLSENTDVGVGHLTLFNIRLIILA